MKPDELLLIYDEEVRGSFAHRLPPGWEGHQDGPLTRCVTTHGGFAMFSEPADHLGSEEIGALVDRTVRFFAARKEWFEWKTFDHDRPDLRPLLLAAGAVPQQRESLV